LPQGQQELPRWTRVVIDVDEADEDAEKLAMIATPAFRILTASGKVVASSDGVIYADKFTEWLKQHFEAASLLPETELSQQGEPDSKAVFKLIGLFRNRDATVREAAIRRLAPYPDLAAPAVVAGLMEGTLATRLVALELLEEWKAPIGDLDPWRAETVTEPRLRQLSEWAATAQRPEVQPPREMTAEELTAAREMLDRLVRVTLPEATALREQLARFGIGKKFLPEVISQIQAAPTDEARERLTALRYRLVATDALVLGWPGGIDRLAATDATMRKQAADELTKRATSAEEPLLLELFSDPSPLIRELSLRALRTVGDASVNSALINMLSDPEPNVRAAVLKQLAEEPSATIAPKIVEYVLAEKDTDLVVHGIRVLGELSMSQNTTDALEKLLKHESWRVRAEAAEALGKTIEKSSRNHSNNAANAAIYTAIMELLKDPDGFVVGRAVGVLKKADLAITVKPLIAAAEAHPDLAPEVIKALSQMSGQRALTIPEFKKFLAHANPKVRSTAILSLSHMAPTTIDQELRATLQDAASEVRTAAAQSVLAVLGSQRHKIFTNVDVDEEEATATRTRVHFEPEPEPLSILGGVFRLFNPSPPRPARPMRIVETSPIPVANPPAVKTTTESSTTPADPKPDASKPVTPKASKSEKAIEAKPKAGTDNKPAETKSELSPDAPNSEAVPPAPVVVDDIEKSLLKIRGGKAFDQKWYGLIDLLKPLLTNERIDERVAGALALVALGQDQLALPILEQSLTSDPQTASSVALAIPWVLAADRQHLFDLLVQHTPTLEELHGMTYVIGTLYSPHSEGQLWSLASNPRVKAADADHIRDSLIQYYLRKSTYQISEATPKRKKVTIEAATVKSKSGTDWQRLIALALLVPLDAGVAIEQAKAVMDDAQADPTFRADALQIMFLTMPPADARRLAVAQLEQQIPALRTRGLQFLALGRDDLPSLQDGHFDIQQSSAYVTSSSVTKGVSITPEPPAGVTAEQLLPVLNAGNLEDAAYAGYMLALLDHPEGLPPLLQFWEQYHRDNRNLRRLVYRAISRIDDASHVGTLKEIFGLMMKDQYWGAHQMPEFYWTIRIMTGPEILELRKTIRTEFGAEKLNQ
jgi:HEAT repeat protein